jgi:ZIP family zinc transporter
MKAMRRSGQAAAAGRGMTMPADQAEAARGKSIAVGLFVDGVPESIALGLTVAEGEVALALLVGIVVGNVVEGYWAAQPIITGGRAKRFAVALLGGIGFALTGLRFSAAPCSPTLATRWSEALRRLPPVPCSLSSRFRSSPHAFAEVSSRVATATVLGFTAGYLLS